MYRPQDLKQSFLSIILSLSLITIFLCSFQIHAIAQDPPPLCNGDSSEDGDVDGTDMSLFSLAYDSMNGDENYNPIFDFDDDGDVDTFDLVKFADDFGRIDCIRPPVISHVTSRVFSDNDDVYPTGSMVRIDVEESSGANVVNGMIRITSASQGYDSGIKELTLDPIFFHWDSTDLSPSSDYVVEVTLVDAIGQTATDNSLTITLTQNPPSLNKLISDIDVSVQAVGLPVRVVRTYILDLGFDGPLGFGWTHTYLMQIVEAPDGLVNIFNADGSGSFFKPNGVATYESPKDDYRTLTKNTDGTYELREKIGVLYKFNNLGRLTSITDRNGNALALGYDSNGLLETITDPSGQITRFFYNAENRLSSITDPAGRSVYYEFDALGHLSSFTNTGGHQTTYTYDTNRNLTTITDPTGRRTFFTIYPDDRLESVSGEGENNKLTYEYETPAPDQMTVTDALGNKTIQTYDNNALITEITDPLGISTSFSYDENYNMTSLTDGNGSTSTFTFDSKGNILTSTDALGNTTTMTYELTFNQMTRLTDSKGNITTFDYDSNGNQTAVTYPDGSFENLSYDASGNLLSKTDRMNQTINFNYDFRGLLTAKLFPDGTSDIFTYDTGGNLIDAEDENGTIEFSYDASDRLIEVNYPGGEDVSYTYDASNNRTQITYPDGTVLDYGYDESNRLAQIGESSQIVAQYAYDQLSRVIRRDLGNGNLTTYRYDSSGRLLDLINSKSTSDVISRFSYTYDNIGNRLTMTTMEGTIQYIYDDSNQLTEVIHPNASNIIYNIDPAGNRKSVVVDGSTTDYTTNNLNQYTDVGGDTYTYDASGNLTSKTGTQGTTTYTYDFENRLIQVDTPVETIIYTYDPFGRKTTKTTSCCTTNYIYDNNRIIMETDVSGTAQAIYIYGIGIDEVLVMNRVGADYFYAQDGLGSVTDLTDFSENIVDSYSYDAYGTPSSLSSVGNPYLFTGREYEPQTGMYFYRARYYNPQIGRFITTDPIGFKGGTNLYNYVSNNPINFVDPLGLFPGDRRMLCHAYSMLCSAACTLGIPPGLAWLFERLTEIIPGSLCNLCKQLRERCANLKRGDPTFIQVSERQVNQKFHTDLFSKNNGLIAKISVPYEDSLVRGDVPIFGLAYGKKFKEYRIEVGKGSKPVEWVTLAHSQTPLEKDTASTVINDPGDWVIEGNMATWDTGLKNYIYLPSHPADHPVNLKGTYTIRLVVSGIDGNIAEDRVTVEVANVIPNALGGKATSADGRAVLTVPEQAIMESFRLISIKNSDAQPKMPFGGRKIIGNVYDVREAGEQFTKEAVLQISFSETDIGRHKPSQLGIYGYESKEGIWEYIPSTRREGEQLISARIRQLRSQYALLASDDLDEGSTEQSEQLASVNAGAPRRAKSNGGNGHHIIMNTFEDSLGEWFNRDGDVGAEVTMDDAVTFEGTRVLKITNTNIGGNFAVTVVKTPFDASEYPLVEFDYRVPPEVKIDFLVKVSGRWYNIGFTDDPKEFTAMRVNMAHIGNIEGVIADDQWRTAQINLYDMLRTKTGNTLVEEIIMADWDVGGFMKLQFGNNPKAATFYIDNFTVRREFNAGLRKESEIIVVDNFNQKNFANMLGGKPTIFADGGEISEVSFAEDNAAGNGNSLKLSYSVPKSGSFAGYGMDLNRLDLRDYSALRFFVKLTKTGQELIIGLRDGVGNQSTTLLNRFLKNKTPNKWQQVTIPLVVFGNDLQWSGIERLILSFANSELDSKNVSGTILVDDIEFKKYLTSVLVDDFEQPSGRNSLGRQIKTFVHGAAAVNGFYTKASHNGVYGLSFGGNIGEGFLSGFGLSYSGWTSDLGGIDCSRCTTLTFRIRGTEEARKPNIYLSDGTFRWNVDLEQWANVSNEWQTVSIPLKKFSEYGADLTHLAELQFAFEWEKMSGTIYLDDITFE